MSFDSIKADMNRRAELEESRRLFLEEKAKIDAIADAIKRLGVEDAASGSGAGCPEPKAAPPGLTVAQLLAAIEAGLKIYAADWGFLAPIIMGAWEAVLHEVLHSVGLPVPASAPRPMTDAIAMVHLGALLGLNELQRQP